MNHSSSSLLLQKESVLGGPITCVAFIPTTTSSTVRSTSHHHYHSTTSTCNDNNVRIDDHSNNKTEQQQVHPNDVILPLLYSHGPYINRIDNVLLVNTTTDDSIINNNNDDNINVNDVNVKSHNKDTKTKKQNDDQLLVFPNGGIIHGIRYCNVVIDNDTNDNGTTTTTTKKLLFIGIIFGGQQMSFIHTGVTERKEIQHHQTAININDKDGTEKHQEQHHEQEQQQKHSMIRRQHIEVEEPMSIIQIQQPKEQQQNQQQKQQKDNTVLLLSDWIWDCRCIPIDDYQSNHHHHNTSMNQQQQQQQPNNHFKHQTNSNNNNDDTSSSSVNIIGEYNVFMGLAHNTVECWKIQIMIQQSQKTVSIQTIRYHIYRSHIHCISYCMDINLYGTSVAFGTVSNEIVVWDIPSLLSATSQSDAIVTTTTSTHRINHNTNATDTTIQNTCYKLRGHQGVIHSVQFCCDYNNHNINNHDVLLASASDDRSVRVWQQKKNCNNNDDEYNEEWLLLWTGWGHTSRGWYVKFATIISNNNNHYHYNVLLSTGEDGTLRIWDYNKNNEHYDDTSVQQQEQKHDSTSKIDHTDNDDMLIVLRGHSCQCIWNVDYNNQYNIAVTAGNDGTIALYNIHSYMNHNPNHISNHNDMNNKIDNNTIISSNCCNETIIHNNHMKQNKQQQILTNLLQQSISVPDYRFITTNDDKNITLQQQQVVTPAIPQQLCNNNMDENNNLNDSDIMSNTDVTLLSTTKQKSNKKKQKQKKHGNNNNNKIIQQVVVGMTFFTKDEIRYLAIATRNGSFMYVDVSSSLTSCNDDQWIHCEPWYNTKPFKLMNDQDQYEHDSSNFNIQSNNNGCCMKIHPKCFMTVIGTTSGNIILYPIRLKEKTKMTSELTSERNHIMLCAYEQRAVQKLVWINDHILLSFHAKSAVWWVFDPVQIECDNVDNSYQRILVSTTILHTNTNGMGICCAYHDTSNLLAIGDTRGNIIIFSIIKNNNDTTTTNLSSVLLPYCTLSRVHQKEHVACIVWNDQSRISSVGNDGCIVESIIIHCPDGTATIQKLLSIPIGGYTGLSHIWLLPNNKVISDTSSSSSSSLLEYNNNHDRVIVGGYHGNRFAIIDVNTGYEFFSIDTGGRQRSMEVYMSTNKTSDYPLGIVTAVCANLKNGLNDIIIKTISHQTNIQHQIIDYSIGIPCHGETIFDLCWFPLVPTFQTLALLTGSEDCTSKIFIYHNKTWIATKLLPPQVSGIRAVCSSSSCNRTDSTTSCSTLIVLGGKLNIECYLVNVTEQMNIDIIHLCTGILPDRFSIDHRINCLKAVPLSTKQNDNVTTYVVVTGDSNGSCYFYLISDIPCTKTTVGKLLYRHERPIISLDIVICDTLLFLFLGTTEGDLLVFAVNTNTDFSNWNEVHHQNPLLIRYRAHQMGTNALSARRINDDSGDSDCYTIRVCSGGDDQRLSLIDIKAKMISGLHNPELLMVTKSYFDNAALSALKGVKLIQHNQIVTTGYDQRLSLWSYDDDKLVPKKMVPIDIGDVNCLASCELENGKHIFAVGGAGIEIVSLDCGDKATLRLR